LESWTGRPLTLLGISTFISILNYLNSLRNQSDQTVLTPNRPSCLIPSPSLQATTTIGFLSRSTADCVHICILSIIFTFISHRCIFPLCPSLHLSVSWLPSSQSPNDPMTLRAFRGNRFEFLLEIFTLNSRRVYHDLPTRRTGASSLPPSAGSPRTITRLTIPQADVSIPGMFSLGLCQDWAVAS
jgi:hypothetical protein